MTAPDFAHPLITGGGELLRAYTIGPYKSVLIKSPESFGPVKYRYILIVYGHEEKQPILFVTSEQNAMQSELLKVAKESDHDFDSPSIGGAYFLGVFSKNGHSTLDLSEDWGRLGKFEEKALSVTKEMLGLTEEPKILLRVPADDNGNDAATEPTGTSVGTESSKIHVFAFVGAMLLAVVIFKAYDVVGDWFQGNPWYVNIGIFVGFGWLGTALVTFFTSKA